jgi:outer membrane protein assembly factor BamB
MRTLALLLTLTAAPIFAAIDWPQYRGPTGDGHSPAKNLPVEVGEDKHVKWKTPIQGKAWSSPVVGEGKIWLTNATEDGKQLSLLSLDEATGKILQDVKLFDVAEPQFCHKFNSYASPTPVLEAGRIYVSFGSPGIACVDTATMKIVWERRDFICNHFRGAGSSPIVWENLLILTFDGSDKQYLAAVDKLTGKTVWETPRSVDYKDIQPDGKVQADGDWRKGFGTPDVVTWEGKPILLSSGAKAHYGYEPATGKELFRLEDPAAHSAAARPVTGFGMWFVTPGFNSTQVIALKLGGHGVLDEKSVAWREKKGAPVKPSLILEGEYLYSVDDKGLASCVEAKTGQVKWRERAEWRPKAGGDYSASPIISEGKLYLCSENGGVTVLAAAPEFKNLGGGKFAEGIMASPATAGNALYVRTKGALYRVEQ